jgi:hypothetical protein
MKTKVIKFLQNLPEAPHDQFNEAFSLYRDSEGKNLAVEKAINVQGYAPGSLKNLLYDLQKLHGITDVEIAIQLETEEDEEGVVQLYANPEGQDGNEETDALGTKSEGDVQLDANPEGLDNQDETLEINSLKEENENLQSEKEDLEFEKEGLEEENEELKAEIENLKLAPKLDAKSIRVEFPFLNEKDCPDEMKILVSDKITAWNGYLDIQNEIAMIESGELKEANMGQLAELAEKAIALFDENQKIYDELNCYQTTGKILGVHPIFNKLKITREVEEMTPDELIKYKSSSAKFFSVKKTALEKAKKENDEVRVFELEAQVTERSEKLFLVNKKLGI